MDHLFYQIRLHHLVPKAISFLLSGYPVYRVTGPVFLLCGSWLPTHAQTTNYIANTANASAPGKYNTLVGNLAGYSNTTAYYNTFVGYQAVITQRGIVTSSWVT